MAVVIEGLNNNTLGTATALPLVEDPAGRGLWSAFGSGAIDPAVSGNAWSDPDYWRFEALAGDRVSASMDTSVSDLNSYFEIRSAADIAIASSQDDGPGTDAFVSNFVVPSSGTYYVRAGKESSSSVSGSYGLRIDLARGIDLESDANYRNNSISQADNLRFSHAVAGHAVGTAAGNIMAGEAAILDIDYFSLGLLTAGNAVDVKAHLPSASILQARVSVVDSQGMPLADTAGDGSDDHFLGTVVASGVYFAKVEANSGSGHSAQYVLDVDIADSIAPTVTGLQGIPGANGTTSSLSGRIVVSFSEQIDLSSVNSGVWVLRSAGLDDAFNTADDGVYGLASSSNVNASSQSVELFVESGPPTTNGRYRFSIAPGILDRAGNPLDGDANGAGGDQFERTFSLALPNVLVPEGPSNDTQQTATPLTFTEAPSGSGYFHSAVGLGSIDPLSDSDWWSF
ncbi:MAG: Ig-like domain-containing protein, partial [Pirellulales bacterium]|nr:Ig-like domain-containing protein [Pirellulales bacterium]